MSSDYGSSDIEFDVLEEIEKSASFKTPPRRVPLRELSSNYTPPASQSLRDSSSQPSIPITAKTPVNNVPTCQAPTPISQFKQTQAAPTPYRLTFGQHKGRTVEVVPEKYTAWLKRSGILDTKADLKAAIDVWDQRREDSSLPPSSMGASIPPQPAQIPKRYSSSQNAPPRSRSSSPGFQADERPAAKRARLSKDAAPLSSYPSSGTPVASSQQLPPLPPSSKQRKTTEYCLPPSSSVPSSKIWEPSDGEFRLDFGKHTGKTLLEVPATYIAWIKKEGSLEKNQGLAAAVADFERNHPPGSTYELPFGKHKGMRLTDVPPEYVDWLKGWESAPNHLGLLEAISYFEKRSGATARKQVERKLKRLGGIRTGGTFSGGSKFDYYKFSMNGEHILITPSQALEYFGLQSREISSARLSTRGYAKLYTLRGVYEIAKGKMPRASKRSCDRETPMQALTRFKRECGDKW